jgi:Flp pilus assembly protein TadD
LPQDKFQELGLNLAAVSGLSGDWSFSLDIVQRLLDGGDDSLETKLWHLRSLIELERFAEALAVSQSTRWGSKEWVHVNYLSGIAFEALGLVDEARNRWESVLRADPQYRDIALRLSRY